VNWHRFFFGRRRKPQTYRAYRKSRERRERYAQRYAAEHPKNTPETFQAAIRLVDGTELGCEHDHRTRSAAQACGQQMARDHAGGAA
jgi:hypothetical protein